MFSKSGVWWVQPETKLPFTEIEADATWKSSTHLGTEYAAFLVDAELPPAAIGRRSFPREGEGIVARTVRAGDSSKQAARHVIQFSGYEWSVRAAPSDRGGRNDYDPANAWTDDQGAMHLRIAGQAPGLDLRGGRPHAPTRIRHLPVRGA